MLSVSQDGARDTISESLSTWRESLFDLVLSETLLIWGLATGHSCTLFVAAGKIPGAMSQ
jgi:hypothetical protein